MRHLVPLISCALVAGLAAQQPTEEFAPQPGTSHSSPDTVIDCTTVAAPFDTTGTSSTGSNQVLGVANVNDTRMGGTGVSKWFFSDRAGQGSGVGSQAILIYDSDAANYPDASTARQVPHAPSLVTSAWGHRDGEGYTYVDLAAGGAAKAVVFFGDEGGNVTWLDAVTETWSPTVVNLTGTSASTLRALAVRRDEVNSGVPSLNTEKIKVYVSNWSSGFEVWNVDLVAGTAVQDTSNPPITSPSGTYGATIVDRGTDMMGNRLWFLVVHHQDNITCPGTGQVKITVIDINVDQMGNALSNYGNIVYTRSMDVNVLGGGNNTAGGLAGGLESAVVNGQPCLAGMQQASNDTCGFVGYNIVQGLPGPQDCGAETLIMDTDGTVLDLQLLNRNPGLVYAVGLGFPPATGTPLPFNPACTIDLSIPVPAFFLLLPGASFPSISVPAGFSIDFVADSGALGTPITSTNRVDIKVCSPPPF